MKKYIYFDLFHLSLVLSLLRFSPNVYRGISWYGEPYDQDVYLGDSAAYTQARFHNLNNHEVNGFVHPKNIDNAIEHSLFIRDVNSIYRRPLYNSQQRGTNIFAYILNDLRPHAGLNAGTAEETPDTQQGDSQNQIQSTEPTQADLDLIEILWKQDADTGVSQEMYDNTWSPIESTEKLHDQAVNISTSENVGVQGMDLTNSAAVVPNHYADAVVDQAFSLFEPENGRDMPTDLMVADTFVDAYTSRELVPEDLLFDTQNTYTSNIDSNLSLLEQLHDLQQMVSDANINPYPEDFGPMHSDLSSNYNNTENNSAVLDALLQDSTLMLPFGETLLSDDQLTMEHDINMNSLLSFLNNDSDPNPVGAVGGQDHIDVGPDLAATNLTVDNTFLSQLMSEDNMDFSDFANLSISTDLQNDWPVDTISNDSAVSGMGSDWSDSCSRESGDMCTKDYSNTGLDGLATVKEEVIDFQNTPDSPHKFNLFGKQGSQKLQTTTLKNKLLCKSEDPDEEYVEPSSTQSYRNLPRFALLHNHTYHHSGDSVKDEESSKLLKEKSKAQSGSQKHASTRGTRDDKRLLGANLPLSIKEVVDLPIEKFNERMSQLHLSEEELALIRDIRRRGKNKVAAQMCRKRKVDQISDLQTVIEELENKRDRAYANMEKAIAHRDLLKQKYQQLHRFIFPGCDPPDPVPASYFRDDSVVPPANFSLNSNSTNGNDNEHKKRGKHKERQ